ncbi:hypothetical protein FOF52_13255 [Thermobifida alba]|jgi:uncharacterized integral membrane protein|uniref:Integral membrane protein n=1 Tax=Thermobifida alba TaxID=53522 RepID=A0ABY4L6U5_THEAE|nr:hypothetical protein [Thermobifida alba]UPT21797.1 hypothetical protein FOF52_13255 [Thermobifida alba]HLU95881.1 hypothetical protein [Thermobifida alba]
MSRRSADWASLVAGLLFVLLGLAFVVSGTTAWEVNVLWVLPVLAIGLGLVGVVRALVRSRDRPDRRSS